MDMEEFKSNLWKDHNCCGVDTRMEEEKSKIETCGGLSAVDGGCKLSDLAAIQKQ